MNHDQLRIVADLLRDRKIDNVERINPGAYFVVVYVLRQPTALGPPTTTTAWWCTAEDRAARRHIWDLGPAVDYSAHSVRVIWTERGRVTSKVVVSDGPMPRTAP